MHLPHQPPTGTWRVGPRTAGGGKGQMASQRQSESSEVMGQNLILTMGVVNGATLGKRNFLIVASKVQNLSNQPHLPAVPY